MDIDELAELLHETSDRHDVFEKSHTPHHWWEWYAAYLHAREEGRTADESADAAAEYMEARGVRPL